MRALDADAPVARLAALERAAAADHLADAPEPLESSQARGRPTARIAAWTAAMS